jgi:hypothetical protein
VPHQQQPARPREQRCRHPHRRGAHRQPQQRSAAARGRDDRVLCLAETTKSSILIDPDTLDTVGKFRYADKLGGMMIQSAHPITVTTGGEHNDELLMVLPDLLAPRRGYLVVRMASGSNKRKVISRVDCRGGPCWDGCTHSPSQTGTWLCRRCRSGTRPAALSVLQNRPNYKSTSIKIITEVIKFSYLSSYNSDSPMKSREISNQPTYKPRS